MKWLIKLRIHKSLSENILNFNNQSQGNSDKLNSKFYSVLMIKPAVYAGTIQRDINDPRH